MDSHQYLPLCYKDAGIQTAGNRLVSWQIVRGLSSILKHYISKIFIWQAIVRGQSVSTEGPFLFLASAM